MLPSNLFTKSAELSSWSERLVGVTLIGIGLWGLRRGLGEETPMRIHKPGGHAHVAGGVGILHGLAGSAHFLGVLPALLLPTTAATLSYLAAFGLGSVAAMAGFSWIIGDVLSRHVETGRGVHRLP